jgi:hypothetical protein
MASMESVSLEDRDWYRENPSEAWTRIERSVGTRPYAEQAPHEGYPPAPRPAPAQGRRVPMRGFSWVVAVVVLAAAAWGFRHTIDSVLNNTRSSGPTIVIPHVPTDPKVVRLQPQAGLDTLVSAATTWSIADPRFGRISVDVPVGETPRQALSIELAERGYQLVG